MGQEPCAMPAAYVPPSLPNTNSRLCESDEKEGKGATIVTGPKSRIAKPNGGESNMILRQLQITSEIVMSNERLRIKSGIVYAWFGVIEFGEVRGELKCNVLIWAYIIDGYQMTSSNREPILFGDSWQF